MMRVRAVTDGDGRGIGIEVRTLAGLLAWAVFCVLLTGCGDKFWDPTQVGRFRPTPAVNVILDTLGVAEEAPSAWVGAEDPRPIDVQALETDYALNPGDVVNVIIFELLQEGQSYGSQHAVTESGKISIPEVGVVQAAGLTETQLEEEIRQILSPGWIKEPSVTVTLVRSDRRTVSVLGVGVTAPGRYFIPRYGFRLADAIAGAGGISEFNVSNIYVSRRVTGEEQIPEEPAVEQEPAAPEREMLEMIFPQSRGRCEAGQVVVATAELATNRELAEAAAPEGLEGIHQSGRTVGGVFQMAEFGDTGTESKLDDDAVRRRLESLLGSVREQAEERTMERSIEVPREERIEWIFKEGKWVPVRVGEPAREPVRVGPRQVEPLRERIPSDFGWEQIGAAGVQTRVIRIPFERFQSGDPRYNVVIRPGDTIYVPVDIIGEFYIMGNTNRQGAIALTGRPMTLKMAIAAAGGLGVLAWPKRCEVIRRLSDDREEIVMVDLDKIARGGQPDFYIKPDDLINVGTHPTARWRAVLRNAFRATYGFGFVYDRNFADRDFLTRRPVPDIF